MLMLQGRSSPTRVTNYSSMVTFCHFAKYAHGQSVFGHINGKASLKMY